jgi:selenide,water dikinase
VQQRNLTNRKRVMDRSIRLGHCICNPQWPCPCELLREKDVCLCAGERLEPPPDTVRLTRLVERPGCASKIDQASLKRVLSGLPAVSDPRVLVGAAAGDDAGVYQISDDMALVQTVDVFCPSVDDPYTFGQIAAANSVNDVYAMGGRPVTALSILGFPIRELPDEVCTAILRGGIDKMAEAGVAVVGGHSILDNQIKAGFAVTGVVNPRRMVTNAGARAGDVLVLTKPLGTGIIAFAAQIDRAESEWVVAATASMTGLNRVASEWMVELGAHACTDVTGFGLMGHLGEMAAAAGVDVEVWFEQLPLLPGVRECIRDGIVPGAVERNRESSGGRMVVVGDVDEALRDVLFDAQTCGGLLIAIEERRAAELVGRLHAAGIEVACVVGRVRGAGTGRVFVLQHGESSGKAVPAPALATAGREGREGRLSQDEQTDHEESRRTVMTDEVACCNGHDGTAAMGAGASEIQRKFQDFLKAANAPGALDAHTKQAISLALSVLARCEPCARAHVKKARNMGFSDAEIEEAAWMAIAFGGGPVMMFWNEIKREG